MMRRAALALALAACSLDGFSGGAPPGTGAAGAGAAADGGGGQAGGGNGGGAGGSGGSPCFGCGCPEWTPVKLQVASPPPARAPAIAWSGAELGVAWQGGRGDAEIFFTRLEATGTVLAGAERQLTDDGVESLAPAIVWGDDEWAVAWQKGEAGVDTTTTWLAQLDAGGTGMGSEVVAPGSSSPVGPTLAWTGGNYLLLWEDFQDCSFQLYPATVSSDGTPAYDDVATVDATVCPDGDEDVDDTAVALVRGAGTHAIAWRRVTQGVPGDAGIAFTLVTAAGAMVPPDAAVASAPGDKRDPVIAALDDGTPSYGVAWTDLRSGAAALYYRQISQSAELLSSELEIAAGPSQAPAVAANGAEIGLAWQDERDGNAEIYFQRLAADGTPIAAAVRVTADAADSTRPALAWTGAEYAVVWVDERDGEPALYFASCTP